MGRAYQVEGTSSVQKAEWVWREEGKQASIDGCSSKRESGKFWVQREGKDHITKELRGSGK